ncbi:hypothetical protein BH23GEM1_BH23GEM1_05100 [soil metagenome]
MAALFLEGLESAAINNVTPGPELWKTPAFSKR